MTTDTVDKLIWALIYGGLIGVGLGLSVRRTDNTLGTVVLVVGGVIAAAGFALIYVRSRMKATSETPNKTP